jgi:hypothetical protein
MTHFKAIQVLQDRINKLFKEIESAQKVMDEPEMLSDYYYARCDKENFEKEIDELTETMKHLLK